MTKPTVALVPALLAATATAALAQTAPAPAPAPAPAGAVVIVSPTPVVVTTTGTVAPAPAPAPAPAAPGAAPAAATGAPQNHDWNDVNHINGQLVKVGEGNEYLKGYRRTNISTNPIGFILGSYSLSVSHGIGDHLAIRGDIGFMSNYIDEDTTGFSLGISAPLYLRRTYSGAFIEPGLRLMQMNHNDNYTYDCVDCGNTNQVTIAGPEVLFGWHWTWEAGYNVALAFGVGRNWSSDGEWDKIFPDGYLRFGYAFGRK